MFSPKKNDNPHLERDHEQKYCPEDKQSPLHNLKILNLDLNGLRINGTDLISQSFAFVQFII